MIDEPVADVLARLQGLTHMIAVGDLAIPIFTLDTCRFHPQTYELIDRTNKRHNFRMRMYCGCERIDCAPCTVPGITYSAESDHTRCS